MYFPAWRYAAKPGNAFCVFKLADFSGISKTPLKISAVIHKSFIEVDEAGTEAAAATAVVMTRSVSVQLPERPRKVFNADHPFIFMLCDRETKTILFMGKLNKP
ncbi:MAG: hypothetical protein IPP93_08565 [Chitinophagaceae bacterium]|nr:hypothetical protein [Chitinophagaceae bacterium]